MLPCWKHRILARGRHYRTEVRVCQLGPQRWARALRAGNPSARRRASPMPTFPTLNTRLAHRRADFRSVPEMLNYAAQGETGVTFYNAKGEILSALSWHDVRARAHVVARKLIGAGFERGERILITADTWPGFFDVFFGAQYAGLLPVPVSIPVGIGGKEAYLDQLRRQLAASGAVAAVGVDDLAGFLADAAREFPAVRLHGGVSVLNTLPEK